MKLNLNLKQKLFLAFGAIAVLVVGAVGLTNFFSARNTLRNQVRDELESTADLVRNTVLSSFEYSTEGYLQGMAEMYRNFIADAAANGKPDKNGILEIRNFLMKQKIGKSGYPYIMDTNGTIIIHPKAALVGVNLTNNEFIRDMIRMREGQIHYSWKNPGEESARKKVAVFFEYKPMGWIVAASSYEEEFYSLINMETISHNVLAVKIGKNGYPFILDRNGIAIVHPTSRDKDLSTLPHIAEILKKKNGTISYIQQTPGSNKGKKKYALYREIPELGWIIVAGAYEEELFQSVQRLTIQNLILLLISILVTFAIGYALNRNIMQLLNSIRYRITGISSGTEKADLSKRLEVNSDDEIGQIAMGVNGLMEKLNHDIGLVERSARAIDDLSGNANGILEGEIKKSIKGIQTNIEEVQKHTDNTTAGVEELTSGLEEIVRNIENILKSMERQASSVEEGASSIEEMVRNIEHTSVLSNKTHEITGNLNKVSAEGASAVKATVTSIREIAEYSQQIIKILQIISNVAKQTNLLAMNAAIEAAHAGEAGKGFAIVADEIRRMSEDTNRNTREIGEVVNSIVSRIDDSVKLAERAGTGLDMINAYSQQAQSSVSQLVISMEEQNNGAREVLNATQDLVQITEEVRLSMTEQRSATSEFATSLHDIRDLTLSNRTMIGDHAVTLQTLINSLNAVRDVLRRSRDSSTVLNALVDNFILSDGQDAPQTGLKLVE